MQAAGDGIDDVGGNRQLCLTFSNKKKQFEASTVGGRQVDRWGAGLKTERSLRCLLAQATRQANCNLQSRKHFQ